MPETFKIVKTKWSVPVGYLECQGEPIKKSEKAFLLKHYKHELWFPKKALYYVQDDKQYWVARWAVDSAKEYKQNA